MFSGGAKSQARVLRMTKTGAGYEQYAILFSELFTKRFAVADKRQLHEATSAAKWSTPFDPAVLLFDPDVDHFQVFFQLGQANIYEHVASLDGAPRNQLNEGRQGQRNVITQAFATCKH